MKTISDFQVTNHGVDYPDYFPGVSTAYTKYENKVVGIGDTPADALDDALEQLAMTEGQIDLTPIEEGESELMEDETELPEDAGEDATYYVSILYNVAE